MRAMGVFKEVEAMAAKADAKKLLADLRSRGNEPYVDPDGKLRVPGPAMDSELRERVKVTKDTLVSILTPPPADACKIVVTVGLCELIIAPKVADIGQPLDEDIQAVLLEQANEKWRNAVASFGGLAVYLPCQWPTVAKKLSQDMADDWTKIPF